MKQKVLLVNKFFYNRGGDCIFTINLLHLLRNHGHETAVFAMDYPENFDSPYTKYFPRQVDFSRPGLSNKLQAVSRIFGGAGVKQSFAKLLDDFHPDVVHLNNIHSYLSPVVARMAHERGIRVVWTLHDYKLVCPSYSMLSHDRICERCLHDRTGVLKERCMKNDIKASLLAYLEALRWNRSWLVRHVDRFICPSQFMLDKMLQGGFPAEKLVHLSNFVSMDVPEISNAPRESSCCYVGRLSQEKGVETLLSAMTDRSFVLNVAGSGPLLPSLERRFAGASNIHFLHRLSNAEVMKLLSRSAFSVLPSEWYENNPLGAIESLCCGTPVIGAKIGGIPELIDEGRNGLLFQSGNTASLKAAIDRGIEQFSGTIDRKNISASAQNNYSPEAFYDQLMRIYEQE